MAAIESGGRRMGRGVLIALLIIVALVLAVVFRTQVWHTVHSAWGSVIDHIPAGSNQRVAVVIYLLLAIVFGVLFSKMGHLVAYGIGMGLLVLGWAVFWEGLPLLGLRRGPASAMALGHVTAGQATLWAIVAGVLATLTFWPLELRENARRRTHRLDAE